MNDKKLDKEVRKIFKRHKNIRDRFGNIFLVTKIGWARYFVSIFPPPRLGNPKTNHLFLLRVDTVNDDNLFYFKTIDDLMAWLSSKIKQKKKLSKSNELNNFLYSSF